MRPRGVGGLREAFVGREPEIELLLATYRRAVEHGEPHVVTIMGDAGVGKTRLVRELWAVLQDESPAPMRRTGRCLSYGRGITYWPLAEVIKEHFGIGEDDEPERVLEQLRGKGDPRSRARARRVRGFASTRCPRPVARGCSALLRGVGRPASARASRRGPALGGG